MNFNKACNRSNFKMYLIKLMMKILLIKKDQREKIRDLATRLKILWSRNKNLWKKFSRIKNLMDQIKKINLEENEY